MTDITTPNNATATTITLDVIDWGDGADTPIEVQVRPKDALDCQFDAANGYYVIRSKQGGGQRLLLRISRMGAPARPVPARDPSAPPALP